MKILRIAFLSFLLFSCKKVEFDKISSSFWNPKLATPIAYGSFTINDILKQADSIDKYLDANARPVLQLKTSQTINGFSLGDVVKLPDFNNLPQQSIYSFSKLSTQDLDYINNSAKASIGDEIDFGKILKFVDPSTNFNQTVPLNFSNGSDLPSDFRIDQIDFSKGNIQVNVTKGLPHRTVLKFTFNEIMKDGHKLVDSIIYIPNSNSPMTIDLAGYSANFSLKQLSYSIDAIKITPTNNDISSSDQIILGVSMVGLGFKNIQGYFGQLPIPAINDSIKLDQFKDLKGKFGLSDPSITLSVINGFGIPVELDLNKFNVIRKDNSTFPLTVNKPFEMGYPAKIGDADVPSSLELSKNTIKNIDKLLSSETKQIQLGGALSVNKAGDVGKKNFITDKSSISLKADLSVPFTGYASGFTFSDTSDFSLPADNLKSLLVKIVYKNTLPLDIAASITFLDKFNQPIKVGNQLLNLLASTSGKLIKSPDLKFDPVTQSWKLTEKELSNVSEQSISVTLKESDLPYLKNATKVIFSGSFETFGGSESKPVTLYDYYGLSINLFGNVEGSFSTK